MHDNASAKPLKRQLIGLIVLLRPRQWIKNGFVLAPLLFSGTFLEIHALTQAFLTILLFCIASSASYIVNDIWDIESDRLHPEKLISRPLASGQVTTPFAIAELIILYFLLFYSWFFIPQVMMVISAYLLINLAYTFILKHQPVIDIFCIALGFVLRVYAGAMALDVPVSSWMFITTLSLALYLAAIKRRQELRQNGSKGRQVLIKYSSSLIERYAEMSATAALLFYSMFVMSSRPELLLTIPLVMFGLFRYWFVVETFDAGESPGDAVIEDLPLLLTVVLWVLVCTWILWPVQH